MKSREIQYLCHVCTTNIRGMYYANILFLVCNDIPAGQVMTNHGGKCTQYTLVFMSVLFLQLQ